MKVAALIALVAWLSIIAGLWGIYLGHALDWRAGLLFGGCALLGLVAGSISTRYQERKP